MEQFNYSNDSNAFSQKVRGLTGTESLIADIKAKCSLADIKEIIKPWIPLTKKFDDGTTEELIEFYTPKIKLGDAISLSTYLQSAVIKKKPLVLDIMTLVTEKTTHVEIGANNIALYEGEKSVSKDCIGGVLGGTTGAHAIAQVMSVCVKNVVSGKENKKRSYNVGNSYAPQASIIAAMTNISELASISPSDLNRQAMKINALDSATFKILSDTYNASVPKTLINGRETPIAQIEEVNEDGHIYRDVLSYPFRPTRYLARGEFVSIAKQFEVYSTGSKFPAIKRLGRKSWTGTPIDNLPCDHVIALHDAGVPVDSKILVCTPDTNLISLLRSNFGPNVMGVSHKGNAFVPPSEAKRWDFDFIYYPYPITMSTGGAFEDLCKDFKEKFLKHCSIYTQAQPICHISPLALYCEEFCAAFGIKVKQDATIAKISVVPDPEFEEQLKLLGTDKSPLQRKYLPSNVQNYPMIPSRENLKFRDEIACATYYQSNPSPYHKLEKVNTFTQLTWGALDGVKFNGALTQMSQFGTILLGGTNTITMERALGGVLAIQRDVFKSIWHMGHSTYATYKIRLFIPGAVVEDLVYTDEFSALYRTKERSLFDEQDKKYISQIAQGVIVPKPSSPPDNKQEIQPKRLRPKASDLADFGVTDD